MVGALDDLDIESIDDLRWWSLGNEYVCFEAGGSL